VSRARLTVLAVTVAAAVAAAVAALALASKPSSSAPPAPSPSSMTTCERLVVPAYFNPPDWPAAIRSKPPPSAMILDISGMGAGLAPEPGFRAAVDAARAAGITVLGYVSTEDGQRPLAQDKAEIRNYAAWYGVTSIFLDRVSGDSAGLGYYRALASYVRARDSRAQLWLNPGDYPDRSYMSLGGVVMTFEGTYAQYATVTVPAWARDYPASRFAHTVYATSAADLWSALRLAAARNAGYVYITDGSGTNPYQALPGYWAAEDTAATAACGNGTQPSGTGPSGTGHAG
jgi:hypothetical protein